MNVQPINRQQLVRRSIVPAVASFRSDHTIRSQTALSSTLQVFLSNGLRQLDVIDLTDFLIINGLKYSPDLEICYGAYDDQHNALGGLAVRKGCATAVETAPTNGRNQQMCGDGYYSRATERRTLAKTPEGTLLPITLNDGSRMYTPRMRGMLQYSAPDVAVRLGSKKSTPVQTHAAVGTTFTSKVSSVRIGNLIYVLGTGGGMSDAANSYAISSVYDATTGLNTDYSANPSFPGYNSYINPHTGGVAAYVVNGQPILITTAHVNNTLSIKVRNALSAKETPASGIYLRPSGKVACTDGALVRLSETEFFYTYCSVDSVHRDITYMKINNVGDPSAAGAVTLTKCTADVSAMADSTLTQQAPFTESDGGRDVGHYLEIMTINGKKHLVFVQHAITHIDAGTAAVPCFMNLYEIGSDPSVLTLVKRIDLPARTLGCFHAGNGAFYMLRPNTAARFQLTGTDLVETETYTIADCSHIIQTVANTVLAFSAHEQAAYNITSGVAQVLNVRFLEDEILVDGTTERTLSLMVDVLDSRGNRTAADVELTLIGAKFDGGATTVRVVSKVDSTVVIPVYVKDSGRITVNPRIV